MCCGKALSRCKGEICIHQPRETFFPRRLWRCPQKSHQRNSKTPDDQSIKRIFKEKLSVSQSALFRLFRRIPLWPFWSENQSDREWFRSYCGRTLVQNHTLGSAAAIAHQWALLQNERYGAPKWWWNHPKNFRKSQKSHYFWLIDFAKIKVLF